VIIQAAAHLTFGEKPEKVCRAIEDKVLEKVRHRDFESSRSDLFRYRTHYFRDSGIIGSWVRTHTNANFFYYNNASLDQLFFNTDQIFGFICRIFVGVVVEILYCYRRSNICLTETVSFEKQRFA
jgi:hypothetical protein